MTFEGFDGSQITIEEELDITLENDDLDIEISDDEAEDIVNNSDDDEMLDIEETNFIESYVKNIFLESIIDDNVKEIDAKIVDLGKDQTCNILNMIKVLESINQSSLHRTSKDKLVTKLFETYNNTKDLDITNENSELFLEYSGNPQKNAEFIKYLNLVEEYAHVNIDYMNLVMKLGDDIIKELSKAKKNSSGDDIRKITDKCLNLIDKFSEEFRSKYKKKIDSSYTNFRKYESLRKKFNNKYSTETLAAKKEMDKKFDALFTETFKEGSPVREWIAMEESDKSPKFDKIKELWELTKEVDRTEGIKLLNQVVNPYLTTLYNAIGFVFNFIRYVRYHFDLEIEYKATYKIIQKLFKDKNGDTKEVSKVVKFKL